VLVATGSLLSVSPDRVVCKRVVLSGHLYKIHRRSAVIRYMFFNRGKSQWWRYTCIYSGLWTYVRHCVILILLHKKKVEFCSHHFLVLQQFTVKIKESQGL